jgi:mycofactocin precursor
MEQDTVTTTETAEITVAADTLVADELLVEEISIDGMCGVY